MHPSKGFLLFISLTIIVGAIFFAFVSQPKLIYLFTSDEGLFGGLDELLIVILLIIPASLILILVSATIFYFINKFKKYFAK